jgi:hypothetical protein
LDVGQDGFLSRGNENQPRQDGRPVLRRLRFFEVLSSPGWNLSCQDRVHSRGMKAKMARKDQFANS